MSAKIKDFFSKNMWLGPVLVGIFLRLYKITFSSIWHDEGYTMWLLKYNILEIIERTARDVHPPGYYLLSKPWVEIFGNSTFSIRFLSLLFSVGIIYFVYKIVKEIWSEKAAFWSSMIVALSPFMVRFGQEARMYGVVAFFTTLATYFFVRMIKEKNAKYLYWYVPAMLIAMYNQYYAFFVIISHWAILTLYTEGFWKFKWGKAPKSKIGVLSWRWWVANVALLIGYFPWFPVAYRQVTRVSGSYWILPEWITWRTIPNNILQFGVYTHLDKLFTWNNIVGGLIWILLVTAAIFGGIYIFKKKENRKVAFAVYIFGFLPMLLVYAMSELRTPVYQDRYFPFSAIAIFAIWGIAISDMKNIKQRCVSAAIIVALLLTGNVIMHSDVSHTMRQLSETVKANTQEGDAIFSGELYTYLDGAYYFGYDNIRLISGPVDGYGETSLFYDTQDDYVSDLKGAQTGKRIWVIGKTGDKEYFRKENWPGYVPVTYYEETDKTNGLKAVLFVKR